VATDAIALNRALELRVNRSLMGSVEAEPFVRVRPGGGERRHPTFPPFPRSNGTTGFASADESGHRATSDDVEAVPKQTGADVAEYLIYFNQPWVGDHSDEWFRGRGPLVKAVVNDIKAAGVHVFAGGLEEEPDAAFTADPTGGTATISPGPYVQNDQFLGGFTIVDVPDDETAQMWARRIAQACGWPQEVRRFKPRQKAE
jgi:hypothetical protein